MQKLAEICVHRPVFATMIILSITVVGMFSFNALGVDLFPKIDLPTITVTVINPGASPQEIETEVTDKVEGAVNTISGIDELRSTSVEGASQVFITFLLEKNADIAAQEVRNKVDLIVNDLPATAEQPIVQKLETDATPVLRIALRHRLAVLLTAGLALGVAALAARDLGSEFVPRLSEGSLVVNVVRLPGTSLEESLRANTRMERALLAAFPDEVEHVWSRCGTAEVATDPMGPEETDTFITLKPRDRWTRGERPARIHRAHDGSHRRSGRVQ